MYKTQICFRYTSVDNKNMASTFNWKKIMSWQSRATFNNPIKFPAFIMFCDGAVKKTLKNEWHWFLLSEYHQLFIIFYNTVTLATALTLRQTQYTLLRCVKVQCNVVTTCFYYLGE